MKHASMLPTAGRPWETPPPSLIDPPAKPASVTPTPTFGSMNPLSDDEPFEPEEE